MSRVPSFDNPQELKSAVRPILARARGAQDKFLEELIDLTVDYLMSDEVRPHASRIRSSRQFAQQVSRFVNLIDERLKRRLNQARALAKKRYGSTHLHIDDLVQCVHLTLLSNRGAHYLLKDHSQNYISQAMMWWMDTEVERLQKFSYKSKKIETDQAPTSELNAEGSSNGSTAGSNEVDEKPKKLTLFQLVYDHQMMRADEDQSTSPLEQFKDESDFTVDIAEDQEQDYRLRLIIPKILSLPKARRSALISRLWHVLSHYATKEELAEYITSPLPLKQRIAILDQIEDDQRRMVSVAFPQINNDTERRVKLATLNRASNHGLNDLQQLVHGERS